MSKVLFISPPILGGTGGEVIRKRNKDFLSEYVGEENIYHFCLDYYAFYDVNNPLNNDIKKNLINTIEVFKPDLIYLDNSLMAIPDCVFKYKTMVFFHNVEKVYASQDKNINEKMLKLIEENENRLVNKADYLVCINKRDSNQLLNNYGRSADYILPISFKDSFIECKDINKKGEYLLFVGTDFYGNTDGLFWFINNCLNDINSKLIVVGKGMEKYNGRFDNRKVCFLGCVKDLSILYANASCVILPIISGSGMKTKTCEAFMYGKKCFGTKEAFEGYENILESSGELCLDAEDFVEKINNYLNNHGSVHCFKSREYYLRYYENDIVKEKYFEFIKEKVNI